MATIREHGTRNKYLIEKCRCVECKTAAAVYARALTRRHAAEAWGQPTPYVDAEPVRAHLRALSAQGMGWKRVAKAAGIATGTVYPILYGKGGADPREHRPPRKRVRRDVAERLLAVKCDIADGALIDATGTVRRLQALVMLGYSVKRIGQMIGKSCANTHTLMRSAHVRAGTARAVAELYEQLWDSPAPYSQSSARARNYAAKRKWLPPLAWDEDNIDDPTFTPSNITRTGIDERAMHVDDAIELIANGELNIDMIAARVGSHPDRLLRRLGEWVAPHRTRIDADLVRDYADAIGVYTNHGNFVPIVAWVNYILANDLQHREAV